MPPSKTAAPSRFPFPLLPLMLLGGLLLGRVIMQGALYGAGFDALTADEFARTVLAAQWAEQPRLIWQGVWLPFHVYLMGLLLRVHWSLLAVPRLVTALFGLASLLLMERLGTRLFRRRSVGLLSAALLALHPAHLWLSATPLTEMIYFCLVLASLLGLVLYLERGTVGTLYGSALALALANGFRYEGWMISVVFSLLVLGLAIARYRTDGARGWLLGGAACLPWLFPLAWVVGNAVELGDPLHFLSVNEVYKPQRYGSERSFLFYGRTLATLDPIGFIAALPALVFVGWRDRARATVRGFLLLAVLPFLIFAGLHGGQVEPWGNFVRYLAPFFFLCYPPIAALLVALARRLMPQRTALLLVIFLAGLALWNGRTAFQFVNDPAAQGLAVGRAIRLLRQDAPGTPVLVERVRWHFFAIHLAANDVSTLFFDRPVTYVGDPGDSRLAGEWETVEACLAHQAIRYLVLASPALRERVEARWAVEPVTEVNGYAFYSVPDSLSAAPAAATAPALCDE